MSGVLTTAHINKIKAGLETVRRTFADKTITYYQYDPLTTEKDPLYDESRNKAYHDPITMQSRVSYKNPLGMRLVDGGIDFDFDGFLFFTRDYLISKGFTIFTDLDTYDYAHELVKNDKFVVDNKEVYVVNIIPGSQLGGVYQVFNVYFKFRSDDTQFIQALGDWLDVERVTTDSESSIQPVVCMDVDGTLRILWIDDRGGIQQVYEDRRRGYNDYDGNVALTAASAHITDYAALIDSYDNLHLVYIVTGAGLATQVKYIAFNEPNPATESLTSNMTLKTQIQLARTSDDRLHVIYQDNEEHYWHLYRQILSGSAWSTREQITNILGDNVNASVCAYGEDLALVWENIHLSSNNIYVAFFINGVWAPGFPLVLSNKAHTPRIVADSNENLYVVWADARTGKSQIYLKKYTSSWSSEIRLTFEDADLIKPDIGVSESGKVIVTYQKDYDIYAIAYENGAVSEPAMVSEADGANTYNHRLLVDPQGIPYVVWDDDKYGNYEIFFRTQVS